MFQTSLCEESANLLQEQPFNSWEGKKMFLSIPCRCLLAFTSPHSIAKTSQIKCKIIVFLWLALPPENTFARQRRGQVGASANQHFWHLAGYSKPILPVKATSWNVYIGHKGLTEIDPLFCTIWRMNLRLRVMIWKLELMPQNIQLNFNSIRGSDSEVVFEQQSGFLALVLLQAVGAKIHFLNLKQVVNIS